MIHFAYLLAFSFFISVVFGAISDGDTKTKVRYGMKSFLQFVIISLAIAWLIYFIPW